jgi:hypothetical protein
MTKRKLRLINSLLLKAERHMAEARRLITKAKDIAQLNMHNPDALQPIVFEDGTVLQVYPSLDEAFPPHNTETNHTENNLCQEKQNQKPK